jgi:hypothetical protein
MGKHLFKQQLQYYVICYNYCKDIDFLHSPFYNTFTASGSCFIALLLYQFKWWCNKLVCFVKTQQFHLVCTELNRNRLV